MGMTFTILEADGIQRSMDPKLDAYRYMAWCKRAGRGANLCVSGKGPTLMFEVTSPGLMTLRFVPIDWVKEVRP